MPGNEFGSYQGNPHQPGDQFGGGMNNNFEKNNHRHTGKGQDGPRLSFKNLDDIKDVVLEAPKDGKEYGRKDGKWVEITSGGGDIFNRSYELAEGMTAGQLARLEDDGLGGAPKIKSILFDGYLSEEYEFSSSPIVEISSEKIKDNFFIIAYKNASGSGTKTFVRLVRVDGQAISYSGIFEYSALGVTLTKIDITKVNDTLYLLSGQNSDNPSKIMCIPVVVDIDNFTLTMANATELTWTYGSYALQQKSVFTLDGQSKVIIAMTLFYGSYTSYKNEQACVIEVFDTNCTFGTFYQTGAPRTGNNSQVDLKGVALSSGSFVIVTGDTNQLYSFSATVDSANVITFSGSYGIWVGFYGSYIEYVISIALTKFANGKVLLIFSHSTRDFNNVIRSSYDFAYPSTFVNSQPGAGGAVVALSICVLKNYINDGFESAMAIFVLNNGAACYKVWTKSGGWQGLEFLQTFSNPGLKNIMTCENVETNKAIGFYPLLNSKGFLYTDSLYDGGAVDGIMQEGGSIGDTKKIELLGGISSVHSGLEVGKKYFVQTDGSIGLNASAYIVGKPISTTELNTSFSNI